MNHPRKSSLRVEAGEATLGKGARFPWGPVIHTIGHSNHPIQAFLNLLQRHAITAVADVRSTPYSRFNPQFRREKLQASLAEAGIQYVFLGAELGARSPDPACYDADGRVSYSRLARTELFRSGIQRLMTGTTQYRISTMCAEREPLECHRTILVARELMREGVPVTHILADGSLETHEHAMQRLVSSLELSDADLFSGPAALTERAYDAQAEQIAYVRKDATKR
jgi:uncharacterized protein (DUF488 family)